MAIGSQNLSAKVINKESDFGLLSSRDDVKQIPFYVSRKN